MQQLYPTIGHPQQIREKKSKKIILYEHLLSFINQPVTNEQIYKLLWPHEHYSLTKSRLPNVVMYLREYIDESKLPYNLVTTQQGLILVDKIHDFQTIDQPVFLLNNDNKFALISLLGLSGRKAFLLTVLLAKLGQIVHYETLLDEYHEISELRSLISDIRTAIDKSDLKVKPIIKVIRNVGYQLILQSLEEQ